MKIIPVAGMTDDQLNAQIEAFCSSLPRTHGVDPATKAPISFPAYDVADPMVIVGGGGETFVVLRADSIERLAEQSSVKGSMIGIMQMNSQAQQSAQAPSGVQVASAGQQRSAPTGPRGILGR